MNCQLMNFPAKIDVTIQIFCRHNIKRCHLHRLTRGHSDKFIHEMECVIGLLSHLGPGQIVVICKGGDQ